MNIGKVIRALRKQKNINQEIFAQKCDISPTSLSQIENGIKRPNRNTIKNICKELKVPEVLLYILATEESDIPLKKKEVYQTFFPAVRSLMLKIMAEEDISDLKELS